MRKTVAYEQLELGLKETPACPNKFTAESTLWCPEAKKLILQVAVAMVKVECGIRGAGGVTAGLGGVIWLPHETFYPCMAVLHRDFDAVRVKNWQTGIEAQVLISVEQ